MFTRISTKPMRFIGVVILSFCFFFLGHASSSDTFYVMGNRVMDPCGNEFIPRGINYAVLDDWNFPGNMNSGEKSAQIIRANPNIVRICWYNDYGQSTRPAYSLRNLDSLISRFRRSNVVSVINLMDVTCGNDYSVFNSRITAWWTQAAVVQLMQKHKGYVIANIANEFGYVQWTSNAAASKVTWKNHYKNTVSTLRGAGLTIPLMIDAPDCGTSLQPMLDVALEIENSDPLKNIVFSAHAYWSANFGYDSLTLRTQLLKVKNAAVPVWLGEVANFQSDSQPCQYPINWNALLNICQELNIGWIAWEWENDYCSQRQLTTNGIFGNFTSWGREVVTNSNYGLTSKAVKASSLIANCDTFRFDSMYHRCLDSAVSIEWKVNSAVNVNRFEIWKGSTPANLQRLTSVSAIAGQLAYRFDSVLIRDSAYYEVRGVSKSGKVVRGGILFCANVDVTNDWVIYPNPVSTELQVFGAIDKVKGVEIFSSSGKLMYSSAQFNGKLELLGYSGGMYVLVLNVGGSRVIRKFVIQ